VQGVAHAEDEEQAPRAPQAGGRRQRRPGEAGHEPGCEKEAGGGGAVEEQLELVERLRLGGRRQQGVADVALHHDQATRPRKASM
jgi:hypothetical protein